jgi:hypothetical protein
MAQTYTSGGIGIVKIGGVDYNVTNCEFTEEVTEVEITNTSNWDPTDLFLYKDRVGVKRAADGTIDFNWDSLNQPIPALRAGSVASMTLDLPNGKKVSFPSILIKSTPIKTGGMDGIYNVQVAFGNKGKFSYI